MDYQQTLDYLYNSLPVFQRIGGAAYKANLDNTTALDRYLGHPHRSFKSIHIAGTNGKGSVSAMAASVLRAAGLRVGLYTSPHLKDFRERITIDGRMIPREEVVRFVAEHKSEIERIEPSFFEVTVAMAFDHFRRSKVDIAVVEVGLGGRLDATNIITPLLGVITNISFDHTQFLGSTLREIASEKAGIIKPGVPLVAGETDPATAPVFIDRARESGSPVVFADQRYRCMGREGYTYHMAALPEGGSFDVELPLAGDYQRQNLCTALAVFDALKTLKNDPIELTGKDIRKGLAETAVAGRWQTISGNPRIIVDTAHNEAGLRCVVRQLQAEKYKALYFVLGVVADKDMDAILPLLPREAYYFFTQPSLPRAMDYRMLAERAEAAGLVGESAPIVTEALEKARRKAGPEDLIFIGGSTFTVAEVV